MKELVENVDFYYSEAGLMVLTERYLLARGYCCGSGCRHCPYHYERVPEPRRSQLLAQRCAGRVDNPANEPNRPEES